MKKILETLHFFIFVLLSLIIFLVIMWIGKIPIHNYNLHVFERNWEAVLHPKESKELLKIVEFGNFGNSNHCDYMVGEFRSTNTSKEEILKSYNGLAIASFDKKIVPIEVYFIDGDIFGWWPWSEWLNRLSKLPSEAENKYLAFASVDGYSPEGDFRCH